MHKHQHKHQHANCEAEPTNPGGAAPEHRQCQYIKADGKGCRDWAHRGQEFCYRHGVFLRAGRGVDVPLLEDEASIVLVLSETLRALAHGVIALKNASLLLDGCRLAHTMHIERVKAANLERSRRRAELREARRQEPGVESPEPGGSPSEPCALSSKPCSEPCAPSPEPCEEPGAPSSEICARSLEPCAETTGRFDPRSEETWQDRALAAQGEALDERMEEELAIG